MKSRVIDIVCVTVYATGDANFPVGMVKNPSRDR